MLPNKAKRSAALAVLNKQDGFRWNVVLGLAAISVNFSLDSVQRLKTSYSFVA